MIASHLVDPSDIPITWSNIAGLDDVIQELKETVILPVQRKDLFGNSNLTSAPKGEIYENYIKLTVGLPMYGNKFLKIILIDPALFS